MALATRIETLDRSKSTSNISGAAVEIKEDDKEADPVTELIDRFRLVLATLESTP